MNSPYNGRFQVTQEFKGAKHDGLDLVGLDSKEIHSTTDGEVVFAGWENPKNDKQGFGQYVVVQDNANRLFHFAHLSEIRAKYGQKVKVGDVIGVEGSTGHSTGSHCHYCVRTSMSPGTFLNINDISGIPNVYYGIYDDRDTTTKPAPKQETTSKKKVTNDIVEAVKAGKYGNGAERKSKLESEGYSYEEVQAAVDESLNTKSESPKDTPTTSSNPNNHEPAMGFDESLSGSYAVSPMGGLNLRKGAGVSKELITTLPWNTLVQCYGYFTEVDGVKWFLIQTGDFEGFVSSQYLSKR